MVVKMKKNTQASMGLVDTLFSVREGLSPAESSPKVQIGIEFPAGALFPKDFLVRNNVVWHVTLI